MALLRAQKSRLRTGRDGSLGRVLKFLLMLAVMSAVPLLLLRAHNRRFEDPSVDLDDSDSEDEAADRQEGPAASMRMEPSRDGEFSIDEELAKIDQQLEAIRRNRRKEEEEGEEEAGEEGEDRMGSNEGGFSFSGAGDLQDPGEFALLPVKRAKDLKPAWEKLIRYSIASFEECESECQACASSVGMTNLRLDTDLMKAGEIPTIGALKPGNETERKSDSLAREIGRCTALSVQAARRTARLKITNAETILRRKREARHREAEMRFRDAMMDTVELEEAARIQERLKMELEAKMELEEEQRKELHDLANPIWYDIDTLRERATQVCSVKARQIARQRHKAADLETSAAVKEIQDLERSCVKDFIASRSKARQEAESLEAKVTRDRYDHIDAATTKSANLKKQIIKLAGVDEIAQQQIDKIRKDAMRTSYDNIRSSGAAIVTGGKRRHKP